MSNVISIIHLIRDFIVTILIWTYFTFGFIVLFMPIYLISFIVCYKRETIYQFFNSQFYKIFFSVLRLLIPGLHIRVSDSIKKINSSILISNHRSFLDPLLLISVFNKQKTIVKGSFFKIPVFGWFLYLSGYIPFYEDYEINSTLYSHIEKLKFFLKTGGNIFIFPEGTRSKDGSLNKFKKGAFRLAKLTNSPLALVYIRNTESVFKPGKFLFNARTEASISIELLEEYKPEYFMEKISLKQFIKKVEEIYVNRYLADGRV